MQLKCTLTDEEVKFIRQMATGDHPLIKREQERMKLGLCPRCGKLPKQEKALCNLRLCISCCGYVCQGNHR